MSKDAINAAALKSRQITSTHAWHGIVSPGSYHSVDGTLTAIVATTLALDPDPNEPGNNDGPLAVPCVLLSPGIGIQAAPQGGERCLLFPLEDNSYGCLLILGSDDSPNVPSGEIWIQRDDPINTPPSAQKQFVKIQTDGATRIGAAAKIALLCSVINLGAESLQTADGVVRKADLQKAINDIVQMVNQMFSSFARTVAGGQGVPPPQSQSIEAEASTTVYATESSQ